MVLSLPHKGAEVGMATSKLKTRRRQSVKPKSRDFPPTSSASVPISRFTDCELRKVLSNKILLPKYLAILKRKGNNGVTLKDLDTLQLELEALLLASIRRRKILLKKCPVLEEELNINYLESISIQKKATIPCNEQQNETVNHFTHDSIGIVIPGTTVSKPEAIIKQRLTKNTNTLAKPLAPQLPAQTLVEEIGVEVNLSFDRPTESRKSDPIQSCSPQTNKLYDGNAQLPVSSCLVTMDNRKNIEKDSNLVSTNNLITSKPKQTLKGAKRKRILKTGKSGRVAKAKLGNRAAMSRTTEPLKKYWQSMNNILHPVTESDVKVLEDLLKAQEATKKFMCEPAKVGQLFATRWAEADLNEERIAAHETPKPRKATGHMPQDHHDLMTRAAKLVDQQRLQEWSQPDSLSNRLLKSLIKEKIIPTTELKNKRGTESQSVIEVENLSDDFDLGSKIRVDLVKAGIISNENIVRPDSKPENDIDLEINRTRDKARVLIQANIEDLNHVIKLAKLEASKQKIVKQLVMKGREIERAYQSIVTCKKKGESARKHINKALKLVQEREIITSKLNDPIQQ